MAPATINPARTSGAPTRRRGQDPHGGPKAAWPTMMGRTNAIQAAHQRRLLRPNSLGGGIRNEHGDSHCLHHTGDKGKDQRLSRHACCFDGTAHPPAARCAPPAEGLHQAVGQQRPIGSPRGGTPHPRPRGPPGNLPLGNPGILTLCRRRPASSLRRVHG